eukprot:3518752-Ditylum_brightwellii.AAC.1
MEISSKEYKPYLANRRMTGRTVVLLSLMVGALLFVSPLSGSGSIVSSSETAPCPQEFHKGLEHPMTDPDPNAPWPRVAWLMSFPNSGTSYTMTMTQRISNLTVASNYGKECFLDENNKTVPVHADSPNGPYLLRPLTKELPERYIITKTHCIGFETGKPPEKYIQTHRTFVKGCARGSRIEGEDKIEGRYDEK